MVFHDFVQLLATAGVHGPGSHPQQSLLEFACGSKLATGKGVFHTVAVVGEVDAHVVPGLVGHFVALVIQGLRVAVGDLDHAPRLLQCLFAHRGLVQQLLLLVFAVFNFLHGPVEFLHVQLEPVQTAGEAQVKFTALVPVVHEQCFLGGVLGDQQCALVTCLLDIARDLVGSLGLIVNECPALVQIVPVGLAAVTLGDLRGFTHEAQLAGHAHPAAGVTVCAGFVVERPYEFG